MNAPQPIVLRWEWRTFGTSLQSLREKLMKEVKLDKPRESTETYLLCLKSGHNAKIRDGLMDLKWRKEVDADGLELWDPVMKSGFPFEAAKMPKLFEAWGLPMPKLARTAYTLEQFLEEIIKPNRDLRAVKITKFREGFDLGGTKAELVKITADGKPMESFCVEHDNKQLMLAATRKLGLDTHQNINYPKGLKQALGLPAV